MPVISSGLSRVAVCAAVLLFAACNVAGSVETVRIERSNLDIAPTPSPVASYEHPLTGIRYDGSQDWQQRPTLVLKVENTEVSRPQTGLEQADLVYEELVEGGITRFLAVFNSHVPDAVGPVRSARMVDPDVLAPLAPLFGFSGGVDPVLRAIRSTPKITDVSFDRVPSAYYRISSREAPHNLYTTPDRLWGGRNGSPPDPLFSFRGQGDDLSGGTPASEVTFAFAENGEAVRYAYDRATDRYLRYNSGEEHVTDDGEPVAPRNVLIQRVDVRAGSIVDTAGLHSPEIDVFGEGEAVLLSGGRVWYGRWERSSIDEPTRFLDADGEPLELGRGQTFVALLPFTQDVDVD